MRRLIPTDAAFLLAVPLTAFAIAWVCVPAYAKGSPGSDTGVATLNATPQGQPAATAVPDQSVAVTTYLQVNMMAFTRVYRPRVPVASVSAGDAVPAIDVLFDKPASRFEFNETPLYDVIAKIRDAHSIQIELDERSLENAGIDVNTPITRRISGISLRSALPLLLDNLDLTYIVMGEVLLITTKEAANERPTVRLYPLPWGIAAQPRPDVQSLIDLLTLTIRPETWDCAGGYGSVRPVGGGGETMLVILQSQEAHGEVESLLSGLHQQALSEFGGPHSPRANAPVSRAYHIADASKLKVISENLVDLCNKSLAEAGDPAAAVEPIAQTLIVQSVSPEFHALAGRMVAAITGVTSRDPLGTTPQPTP
jgi:hypothetical protein